MIHFSDSKTIQQNFLYTVLNAEDGGKFHLTGIPLEHISSQRKVLETATLGIILLWNSMLLADKHYLKITTFGKT